MLPTSQLEPANFLPLLGEKIRSTTVTGDKILTNLAPIPFEHSPYERILPYYSRREFAPGMITPQQIVNYLAKPELTATDNVYFLLWSNEMQRDDALSAWLYSHATPAEISVAGQRFGFFKLKFDSLPTTGTNQGD